MDRKRRFLFGLLFVVFIYSLPLAGFALAKAYFQLLLVSVAFVFSIYLVYRSTIRNIRPKYPIVSPEGHPDVYTGRMPRPIYEDMERYPWFFNKKKRTKKLDNKKIRKRK